MTPAPALAGAWIAPEGGQEILTTVAGEREGLTFYETSTYWEVPLGDDASVVASPWFEQNYDTVEGWRGEATLAFKGVILRNGPAVAAMQAGALWVSNPPEGCSEGGVELRWLGGRSFGDGRFLNIEGAVRGLEGGCNSERIDVSAGFRPRSNWLVMGQVFFDSPQEGDQVTRAQLTLVRFGESGRGLQIGLRSRVDGGPQEAALVVGLWGRPGN
ncbi:MAG: hypothetical protein DCF16_10170 [Alphaproteobacteria bacterium]|nr:MAG: hypothetical protein DCF16_10170 [Alphaproteobacteria bacterium]